MSDELHRVYVRWWGQTRQGRVKVGDVGVDIHKPPAIVRLLKVFDLFFEPGFQAECSMRPGDAKEEMTAEQRVKATDFLRDVGAAGRLVQDVVEG